jgi:hypothetical protein
MIKMFFLLCFTIHESGKMGGWGGRINAIVTNKRKDVTCSCSGVGARIEISIS